LLQDEEAIRDAYYATGEHLNSPEAIQRIAEYWPDSGERVYIKFRETLRKKAPKSVKPDAESALSEKETA